MNTLKVLDLFSGIGGFSLGLERAGEFETAAFCEINKNAQKVLKKHWPDIPIFEDVTTLKGEQLGTIDVICGGFPCQDISLAGKGAGLEGARSGLWFEFHRLIKEIKPSWVIAENVAALRSRGLDQVLRSLAEIGYDAEWHCIPASAVGAKHKRDRVWIIAYPNIVGTQVQIEGQHASQQVLRGTSEAWRTTVGGFWGVEPNVGRVADGVSGRVDRLKQLGNAVVPQIPELIGRAINAIA
jgi:DNA (cytosine-5)-methyltransferase 1